MAESWVATFKIECIQGRILPSLEHAEHEILEWIGFYNTDRLHQALGYRSPVAFEHGITRAPAAALRAAEPDRPASSGWERWPARLKN